jgi:hypothetical protein
MTIINIAYLVEILIPPFLKGENLVLLLKASTKPIQDNITWFYDFYDKKKYELRFNGQIIYLEDLLNNEFDPVLRRIYIDDGDQSPTVYIFNVSENNESLYLFNNSEDGDPTYIYNGVVGSQPTDFVVFVPTGLVYNENLMKFYLNKYKIASKRYKIEEI